MNTNATTKIKNDRYRIRSAMAPVTSATVTAANISWNAKYRSPGIVVPVQASPLTDLKPRKLNPPSIPPLSGPKESVNPIRMKTMLTRNAEVNTCIMVETTFFALRKPASRKAIPGSMRKTSPVATNTQAVSPAFIGICSSVRYQYAVVRMIVPAYFGLVTSMLRPCYDERNRWARPNPMLSVQPAPSQAPGQHAQPVAAASPRHLVLTLSKRRI